MNRNNHIKEVLEAIEYVIIIIIVIIIKVGITRCGRLEKRNSSD